MKFQMSDTAKQACKGWNPRQTCAFVLSSRRNDATVVNVHIGFDTAKREARKIGGCMRIGRVVDGFAETI